MAEPLAFVGQAPSRILFDAPPLYGFTRLAHWAGFTTTAELFAGVRTLNVFDRWPGYNSTSTRGDAFPLRLARARATHIAPALAGHRVIFVGMRTAETFGLGWLPIASWERVADIQRSIRRRRVPLVPWPFAAVALIPHPSGVSHWYNDPKHRELVGKFVRQAVGA